MLFMFTTYVKMLKEYWNLYSFSPRILYTEVHIAAARVPLIFFSRQILLSFRLIWLKGSTKKQLK